MHLFIRQAAALCLGAALLSAPLHKAQAKPAAKTSAKPKSAKGSKNQAQRVVIVADGGGYTPSIVQVRAGRPVQMVFVSKGTGCSNDIVIPALKQKFKLRMGQSKTIAFTPRKGQSIAFACDMDMFHGKVVVK